MSAPPTFPPFHPATETWNSYINWFECVMDAADLTEIPANRKKAYFLSFCGVTVFNTATALLAPQSVKAMTWEELQEVLSNHYMLKLDLDDMLLDQLVCGIRDLHLQRRLLTKADFSLKVAIEEVQAAEMSTLSAAEIQGSSSYSSRRTSAAVHYEEAVNADFMKKKSNA
ncbi:hypothetical protein E2320_003760 [Naja naja]|nr:hypothetical protein E2320_003760 [Naja naja]